MPCSPLAAAKRAFVTVLLSVAAAYRIAVQVNRELEDKVLLAAYRRVALKAHPDKGGRKKDFQRLQGAREKWETAKQNAEPPGAAADN